MSDGSSLPDTWNTKPLGRVAAPLRQQVTAQLREAIASAQLKPGQRLVERELIDKLGVSRTTVREALRELASEGLVTVVPQKGAIVTDPSLEDVEDLYEIRGSLEALMVQIFVRRASDAQVNRLVAILAELKEMASRSSDVTSILKTKDKLYGEFLKGAKSAVLSALLDTIQHRVQVLRTKSLSMPGRVDKMVGEIEAIVHAVQARDADRAAALSMIHVRNAAEAALQRLVDEAAADRGSPN